MNAVLDNPDIKTDDGADTFFSWKTVLFNCNCHSFPEVEYILMKATKCTHEQAAQFAKQIHLTGQAVVFSGWREKCEHVEQVIASIGLRTDVCQ